jgi:hypothetical protein
MDVQLPCSVCDQIVEVTATRAAEYARTGEPVLCRVHWWATHPEPVAVEAPATGGVFQDESGTMLVIRHLSLDDLKLWLLSQPRPGGAPRFFVFHHTESPTEAQWHGASSVQGCFNYFRDARGFPYGHGPQFWLSWDGIWIGHHPSIYNQVGATDWNGWPLHMEMVHNGDASPLTSAQLAMAGQAARIICEWAKIPIQWVNLGSNGGALKTRDGITMHRQCYIGGQEPKSCPGRLITQAQLLQATQTQEDDMTKEQEWWLAKARISGMTSDFRWAIQDVKDSPTEVARLKAKMMADIAAEKLKLDPKGDIWPLPKP